MDNSIVLGVDIGGSHITAALVSLETRAILPGSRIRSHVNSKGSKEEIINIWTEVMHTAYGSHPSACKRMGIAMPGPFNYEEGISLMKNQDKYDALYGLNVKQILADQMKFDSGNLSFINDAECFLKGEVFGGAARNIDSAIGLTLGTGLGSAQFLNGNVEDADLWCTPFLGGIAEDYLSTRWFTSRYYQLTAENVNNVKEIIDMEFREETQVRIFEEFGHNLGMFLNAFILSDPPEAIIIGGNIAKAYDLFKGALHQTISPYLRRTDLKITSLGEDACLIGAASSFNKAKAKAA